MTFLTAMMIPFLSAMAYADAHSSIAVTTTINLQHSTAKMMYIKHCPRARLVLSKILSEVAFSVTHVLECNEGKLSVYCN